MDVEELPDADLEIGATKSSRMVFASGSAVSYQLSSAFACDEIHNS
jgi:hypothetical protein